MAITYPRTLPLFIANAEFEIAPAVTHNPERGGDLNSVEIGQARWIAKFTTGRLWEPRLGEFRAFLASLGNGSRDFYAHDVIRPFPLAYRSGFSGINRAGGGAFDGTVASGAWSLDVSRSLVSFTTLPAGFVLTTDDKIGWSWSTNRRFLVRALEGGTANGSGVLNSITVEPFVPPFVPDTAVLTLARPDCVMRLTPDSASVPASKGPVGVATFQAQQDVRE